jgi:dihydrofolate synthase / folylpolyglutamate synthase
MHTFPQKNVSHVLNLCDKHSIPATFFEIITASAFLHFHQTQCDLIVLECGIGGRYDSTNIAPHPLLSIITSIQYDHMGILGSTLEEIAMEKAGIMRPGVDVIIGPDCPPADLLRVRSHQRNDPVVDHLMRCRLRRFELALHSIRLP